MKEGKQFFFEKKNQKTFAHGARRTEPDSVMAGLDPAIHAVPRFAIGPVYRAIQILAAAIVLCAKPLVGLAQNSTHCPSNHCRTDAATFNNLRSAHFKIVYGSENPACIAIATALNPPYPSPEPSQANHQIQPRRFAKDFDFEDRFSNKIFHSWHPVPLYYNDKNIYFDDNSAMWHDAAPDAWVTANYLNDGITRLVVAWPHGWEYSTFTVDTDKLVSSGYLSSSQRVLTDPIAITAALSHTESSTQGSGLHVLKAPAMSTCSEEGDPLQQPTEVDSWHLTPSGMRCSDAWPIHIHIPKSDQSHYLSPKQIGPFDGELTSTATQFATLSGLTYVLYINTNFDNSSVQKPTITLTPAVLVRVVRFNSAKYTDECLLAAGTLL